MKQNTTKPKPPEGFDCNYYMLGLLNKMRDFFEGVTSDNLSKLIELPKTFVNFPPKHSLEPMSPSSSSELLSVNKAIILCSNCRVFRAELNCINCSQLFCKCCYSQTHQDGSKTPNMIGHKTINLNKSDIDEHKCSLNRFCKLCLERYCSVCKANEHNKEQCIGKIFEQNNEVRW